MTDRRDRRRAAHSIEWLLSAAALNHSSLTRPPTRKPHSPDPSTSPNLDPCPTQNFLLRHLPLPRRTSSLALKSHNGRIPPSYAIRLIKACTYLDSLLWRKCLTTPLPITHFASDYAILRLLTSHVSSGHAPALVILACKSVPTLLCDWKWFC